MRIQEDIPVTAMPDLLSHDRILTAEFMKKNREPLSALCFFVSSPDGDAPHKLPAGHAEN